jgi:hypothetical protein
VWERFLGIGSPAGVKTIRPPDNERIRLLSLSVADENPKAKPVCRLLLPPASGANGLGASTSAASSSSSWRVASSSRQAWRMSLLPVAQFKWVQESAVRDDRKPRGVAGNAPDESILNLTCTPNWRTCEYRSPHVAFYIWANTILEGIGRSGSPKATVCKRCLLARVLPHR